MVVSLPSKSVRERFQMIFDILEVSGFRIQVSGFRFQVSSFKFQVSGFRFQVSGFRFQVSGFRFQVSGFRFLRPVIGLFLSEVINFAIDLLRLRQSL